MTLAAEQIDPPVEDPVSNVLKWVLLVVAIATFGLLAWATVQTYRTAPPLGRLAVAEIVEAAPQGLAVERDGAPGRMGRHVGQPAA